MIIEMKSILFLALAWGIAVSNSSMSYPIYGAKRYHRASVTPSIAYYNNYYDQQAQQQQRHQQQYAPRPHAHHSVSSSPMLVQQPMADPYDSGYVTNNGYYYYPSHEYHTYGMPTYHGEYKPKAIYYAPRPRYSYYEDPELPPNPLDDLHEEILEEDERERQADLIPYVADEPIDNEDATVWYDEEPQKQLPPSTVVNEQEANNFVRNLIEYNRRMEEKQRAQQLTNSHQIDQQPIEYDEYPEINPDDYQFEPQGEVNQFDMQNYRNEIAQTTQRPPQKDTTHTMMEDEDVRELKSLAHKHHSHDQQSQHQSLDGRKNHNEKYFQRKNTNNWRDSPQPMMNNAQYDFNNDADELSSLEYDDDSWINWDRKRSGQRSQTSTLAAVAQAILTTTQKPLDILAKNVGQKEVVLPRPSAPQRHFVGTSELIHNKFDYIDEENTNGNSSPNSVSTPSAFPQENGNGKAHSQMSTSTAKVITSNGKNANHNQYRSPKSQDDAKSGKRSKVKNSSSAGIYETIKRLIAMEEKLQKNKINAKSKIHKRFVTSEESLVNQLNNLKRKAD